jgi:NAD(P)-dependent dehydrogenase (short-subunit alcohol dehydrogenase family)
MPSQQGRTVIITGANSGLGYHSARAFAGKGALVVMACRDRERGEQARQSIIRGGVKTEPLLMHLDLSDLASVRNFSEAFLSDFEGPDLLINNAGLMAVPYLKTADGFEMQFGVNYLGHFALTALLWEGIRQRHGARIVNLTSLAYRWGHIRFGDLHWGKKYSKWGAYAMSKLANLLFTMELARRLEDRKKRVLSVAAHPGYADTELQVKGPRMEGNRLGAGFFTFANRFAAQPGAMGALPVLFAATSPGVVQGGLYGPGGFLGLRGWPVPEQPDSNRVNGIVSRELWKESERLTGTGFEIA